MKEIITMWKYSTMVALTVLCAGIYMLFLLPFKAIQIIPGYTEIRPATVLPVIFGLLFGPAGAWGSAIGNLAGDFFGTFSAASFFGFIGNFLFAYIPYKLWGRLQFGYSKDRTTTVNTAWKLVEFGLVSITASVACALVIAWGADLLRLVPFIELAKIISMNNIVVNLLFGPLLLPVCHKIAQKNRILWQDVMHVIDISRPSEERIYPFMILTGSFGGMVFGIALYTIFSGFSLPGAAPAANGAGSLLAGIGVIPFIATMIYGTLKA